MGAPLPCSSPFRRSNVELEVGGSNTRSISERTSTLLLNPRSGFSWIIFFRLNPILLSRSPPIAIKLPIEIGEFPPLDPQVREVLINATLKRRAIETRFGRQ